MTSTTIAERLKKKLSFQLQDLEKNYKITQVQSHETINKLFPEVSNEVKNGAHKINIKLPVLLFTQKPENSEKYIICFPFINFDTDTASTALLIKSTNTKLSQEKHEQISEFCAIYWYLTQEGNLPPDVNITIIIAEEEEIWT